jgi:F-type H+-transporting ATPase subunit epsilon
LPVEVHVVTPDREVWSGTVESVIARGVDGEVGILAGHAPLLIQLAIGPLRLLGAQGQDELDAVVDGGFMHVTSSGSDTRVDVMATGATLEGEIDLAATRARVQELRAQVEGRDTGVADAELDAAKAELEKAQARITLAG